MGLDDREWFQKDHDRREKKYNGDWRLKSKQNTDKNNKVVPIRTNVQQNATMKYSMSTHILEFVMLYGLIVYYTRNIIDYSATIGLIVINVIVFLLIQGKKVTTYQLGASYYLTSKSKQYDRIITCAFTHEEPLHLLMNMWSLYNVGTIIEKILGIKLYIISYVVIVIIGGAISCYFHQNKSPNTISIGASGTICGLLGIYISIVYLVIGLEGLKSVGCTMIILVLMTFSKKIDSIGHFSGLAVGIVIGYILAKLYMGI